MSATVPNSGICDSKLGKGKTLRKEIFDYFDYFSPEYLKIPSLSFKNFP